MGMEGVGIPVFDGKGYEIWSKKMMTLFISQQLWDLVQQGYQEMTTENREKDCKALYMIQQGVSDSIFPVIMKANTSKEAWETIRDRFHHDQKQKQKIEETEEEKAITTKRMEKMVSKLNLNYPEKCIFRVPDDIRIRYEKFYEPKVLSIGPYHRGKSGLASMEEYKKSFLQDLLKQDGRQRMDNYVQALKPYEDRVRKCYAESIDNFSSAELIQMLILDGCFIIQLLHRIVDRRNQHYRLFKEREKIWKFFLCEGDNHDDDVDDDDDDDDDDYYDDDPISHVISSNKLINKYPAINSNILNDLLLVENQIPFFIIQILYRVINNSDSDIWKLNALILGFLDSKYLTYQLSPPMNFFRFNIDNKYHLLDIVHKSQCPMYGDEDETEVILSSPEELTLPPFNNGTFVFMDSATKLEEANVKLKPNKKFNCSSIFDITFSDGMLSIPCFIIDYNRFEFRIRNFIALEIMYEQHHRIKKRYFCDYVIFMDHLIASADDVKLLIDRGIIINQVIDAKLVDTMFEGLTKNVSMSNHYTFDRICTDLKAYCAQPQNKWFASLKHKYCESPWTIISIVAASMLLLLTIIQTVYSILSYYK